MKKIKLLFLSACLLTITHFSFSNENPKTQCLVSSNPELNNGSCWAKSDGSGDTCVRTDGTPVCSGEI